MWTFIDLHPAFFFSVLFIWTYLALHDWLFCATFSHLALLKWGLQQLFIISTLILSSSLTFPVPYRGSTYWSSRLSCPSLPVNFWPHFTFSSSVILLCFFRTGLAQFLGYTLGSLLDSHPNSLPDLLHLATLEKSLQVRLGSWKLWPQNNFYGNDFLVQFSSVISDPLRPHRRQHARAPVHYQLPAFT